MAPTDPALPQQIAINVETVERLFISLANQQVTMLDVPAGSSFVLGDTPFDTELGRGFTIPLSKDLALLWTPTSGAALPAWTRRQATTAEVDASNKTQAENALKVLIGPTAASLSPYIALLK